MEREFGQGMERERVSGVDGSFYVQYVCADAYALTYAYMNSSVRTYIRTHMRSYSFMSSHTQTYLCVCVYI